MKAYFLSDIHLKRIDEPRAQKLLSFLKTLEADTELTHIFLVGDIFDLWISDHAYFVNKFAPIIEQLKSLRQRGVELHYFEGNHDLYLDRFWENQIGAKVHRNWAVFDLSGLRVRVEHGDLIDPDDHGYRFLRWFLRTPVITWAAHHLHEKLVAQIGEKASRVSRTYTSETKTISKEEAINKIRRHAEALATSESLDFIISGHLHVRDDVKVSGDFAPLGQLIWEAGLIPLLYFNLRN